MPCTGDGGGDGCSHSDRRQAMVYEHVQGHLWGSNYWWLGMDVVLGTMTGFWDQRAQGPPYDIRRNAECVRLGQREPIDAKALE